MAQMKEIWLFLLQVQLLIALSTARQQHKYQGGYGSDGKGPQGKGGPHHGRIMPGGQQPPPSPSNWGIPPDQGVENFDNNGWPGGEYFDYWKNKLKEDATYYWNRVRGSYKNAWSYVRENADRKLTNLLNYMYNQIAFKVMMQDGSLGRLVINIKTDKNPRSCQNFGKVSRFLRKFIKIQNKAVPIEDFFPQFESTSSIDNYMSCDNMETQNNRYGPNFDETQSSEEEIHVALDAQENYREPPKEGTVFLQTNGQLFVALGEETQEICGLTIGHVDRKSLEFLRQLVQLRRGYIEKIEMAYYYDEESTSEAPEQLHRRRKRYGWGASISDIDFK